MPPGRVDSGAFKRTTQTPPTFVVKSLQGSEAGRRFYAWEKDWGEPVPDCAKKITPEEASQVLGRSLRARGCSRAAGGPLGSPFGPARLGLRSPRGGSRRRRLWEFLPALYGGLRPARPRPALTPGPRAAAHPQPPPRDPPARPGKAAPARLRPPPSPQPPRPRAAPSAPAPPPPSPRRPRINQGGERGEAERAGAGSRLAELRFHGRP